MALGIDKSPAQTSPDNIASGDGFQPDMQIHANGSWHIKKNEAPDWAKQMTKARQDDEEMQYKAADDAESQCRQAPEEDRLVR